MTTRRCARRSRALLGAAGYDVRAYAAAGDYLVGRTPADEPGCLLLDLRLPGIDGLQLQAALRRHPAYEHPVVFLSGSADVPSTVQAMRAGACEFLTKPIDRDVLLAAVKDAVERDAALRERRARERLARAHIASLAPRERQVLDGIVADGCTSSWLPTSACPSARSRSTAHESWSDWACARCRRCCA
jgi:FixJ family two-component response regulator